MTEVVGLKSAYQKYLETEDPQELNSFMDRSIPVPGVKSGYRITPRGEVTYNGHSLTTTNSVQMYFKDGSRKAMTLGKLLALTFYNVPTKRRYSVRKLNKDLPISALNLRVIPGKE